MFGLCALGVVSLSVFARVAMGQPSSQSGTARTQIMIVGVAHLVAKNDLHNSSFDDPLSPVRQAQIAEFIRRLTAFHPTKVMIEAPFGNTAVQDRYTQYVKGAYALSANEIDQFGFRLAKLSSHARVYPIDSQGFPFDFDAVKASAAQHQQTALLDRAEAATEPLRAREYTLMEKGTMLELVRFLNTDESINANASWYQYVDRIGAERDYAGAQLVASWYARNLHIFANIMRQADGSDDRVVIFIGAGHVKLLKDSVMLSPDLAFVDPKPFLDRSGR